MKIRIALASSLFSLMLACAWGNELYNVSDSPPQAKIPAAKKQQLRAGMTLGQMVDLLGPAWMATNEGVGIIHWYFDDGSDVEVWPHEYKRDEAAARITWGERDTLRQVSPVTYYDRDFAGKSVDELKKGIADCDAEIKLHPNGLAAYINRGRYRRALAGQFSPYVLRVPGLPEVEGAIADFTRALELAPDNAIARLCRAEALASLATSGDVEKAMADCDAVIKSKSHYTARAYIYLAYAMLQIGKPGEEKNYDLAIEHDQDAFAYFCRGVFKYRNHDAEGAAADFSRSIAIEPQFPPTYACRGLMKLQEHLWDDAIADFNRAISVEPANLFALIHRGDAERGKGDLPGALADYTRAIEAGPRDSFAGCAYLSRASVKKALGDDAGAAADVKHADDPDAGKSIEIFDSEVALHPGETGPYINRGSMKMRKGDQDGAIADFDKVISLDPKNGGAYIFRGEARSRKGDFDAAIADYDRALALNPDLYTAAIYSRGVAKEAKSDWDGAIADYTRYIEIMTKSDKGGLLRLNFASCYLHRAIARHRKGGDLKEAIADYDRALQLDPGNADTCQARGVAKEASGDKAGADADFAQAAKWRGDQLPTAADEKMTYGKADDKDLVEVEFAGDDMAPEERFHTIATYWISEKRTGMTCDISSWAEQAGSSEEKDARWKAAQCLKLLAPIAQPGHLPGLASRIVTVRCVDGEKIIVKKFPIDRVPPEMREILILAGAHPGPDNKSWFGRLEFIQNPPAAAPAQ